MGKIERDGDAGHAIRREPFVREPVMGAEAQPARVELGVDLRDALLEIGAFDLHREIAHPDVEELLVAERRPVGRRYTVGGCCFHHSVSRSYASAMRRSDASSNRRPVSCSPIGSRPALKPHGTLMAGRPVRFALTVNTSARYICKGSSTRSPIRNAGTGLVGIAIASTPPSRSNACS